MIKDNQQKAIDLLVEGKKTITDIAEDVGVSRGTMYNWFKNPKFKNKLQEMQKLKDDTLKENVKGNAEDSIRALEELRDTSKNDMVRYHTASQLLAYAGWNDKQITEINVNHGSEEVRNKMLDLLNESKKQDKKEG